MHHPADTITHTTAFVTPVVEHWLEQEIAVCECAPFVLTVVWIEKGCPHLSSGTLCGPVMEILYRYDRNFLKASKNGQWESRQMDLLVCTVFETRYCSRMCLFFSPRDRSWRSEREISEYSS